MKTEINPAESSATLSMSNTMCGARTQLGPCRAAKPGQAIPTSTGVSAALALVQSMAPENEVQAALAVDAATLNAVSACVLAKMATTSMESRTTVGSNAVAKLQRAFHSAINAFYRVKFGNRQVIRIEKVVIEAGAQAVVGQVVSAKPQP